MSHSSTFEAIVLKTYNVGEADRFCVLLTRERGRLAARASGVRKPKSRMGGSIIPFAHLRLELKESSAGWIVAGAQPLGEGVAPSLASFAIRVQGCELLLRLLQDDEAVPSVFDTALAFFRACDTAVPHALLAFSLRLLHLLGLLPDEDEMLTVDAFTHEEQLFLQTARAGYFLREPDLPTPDRLQRIVDRLVQSQLSSPLKSPRVAAALSEKK